MKEFKLGRSDYWFDPTASEAVVRVGENRDKKKPEEVDVYHATEEEIGLLKGVIFEPRKLISDSQIKRWQRKSKYKQNTHQKPCLPKLQDI